MQIFEPTYYVSANFQNPYFLEVVGEVDKAKGDDGSLAMDIASGSETGFGLATSLRYKLEWEYLRQARINRAISGGFSKPIKHSLRTIRGFGTGLLLRVDLLVLLILDCQIDHGVIMDNCVRLFCK